MVTVKTTLDPTGEGAFKRYERKTERGEMVVSLHRNRLTVYHTQVAPLCPYVHAQFRHHPDQYVDLWTESVS